MKRPAIRDALLPPAREVVELEIAVAFVDGRLRHYLNGGKTHDVVDSEPLPAGPSDARSCWAQRGVGNGVGLRYTAASVFLCLKDSPVSDSQTSDSRIRAAVQKLESLHAAGVTHLPKARMATPSAPEPSIAAPADPPETMPKKVPAPAEKLISDSPSAALAAVQKRVAACTRCAELAATRTQTVFGTGNPEARLVFLGEAPGADEDRQGEPFVGRAGQLLTDIIEKGMGLKRSDVYICNILRCRPPANRNPLPVEAANCREFLDAQLEIIRPEFICCLGAVAAQNLLNDSTPIGKLRGRFLDYQGIKVVCTYHPAYVLRNPPAKKQVWEDIQFLMAEMGLKVAKKG